MPGCLLTDQLTGAFNNESIALENKFADAIAEKILANICTDQ